MDKVRLEQNRPTVALVLSGGGAKGAAQVGALRYIEQTGIPIDFVCGTSIGGLLGGLYSVGYRADDMANLFRNSDWGLILTDKIDQKYIPYSKKMYKAKYCLSIPFHYRKELNLGASSEELATQAGVSNLASSLPSGYAFGFNVNNLFSSLTVGYHDVQSFDNFPTPFMCVASDLVSSKAKYWTSGSINTAMRSTMSIPGLFDPVRTDSMILVDGGTRNNFPADFAKAIGADYIIGIDLANTAPTYEQINNVGNIFSRFISMLGKDSFETNVKIPDVTVRPDVEGFNMLSFNRAAVDTMLVRGYKSALAKADELDEIKAKVGVGYNYYKRKAIDISRTPVIIKSITFEGLTEKESRMMMRTVKLKAGEMVDKEKMDDAMCKLQATEAFETVSYSLKGETEPYDLVFHCVKGAVHQLGLGVRMDTEDWVSIGFRVGLNERKFLGSKLFFTGRLGQTQSADLRYALDLRGIPSINVEAEIVHPKGDVYNMSSSPASMEYVGHQEKIYLSNLKWKTFDIQLGARYFNDRLSRRSSLVSSMTSYQSSSLEGGAAGLFAKIQHYSLDDFYYPTKGSSLALAANYDIWNPEDQNYTPRAVASIDWKFVIPFKRAFAIIPDLHFRAMTNNDCPIAQYNFVGGNVAGRYVEHQIPFCGFGNAYIADDCVAVINLELRARLAKNLYASAIGGYFSEAQYLSGLVESIKPDIWGAAFELGYGTVVGPVKIQARWSDFVGWGGYFSIGFDF